MGKTDTKSTELGFEPQIQGPRTSSGSTQSRFFHELSKQFPFFSGTTKKREKLQQLSFHQNKRVQSHSGNITLKKT